MKTDHSFDNERTVLGLSDYSSKVKALSKEERAWIKRLEEVLLSCPSDRLVLQTIGDPSLQVIDGDVVTRYCLETADGRASIQGVCLARVRSKPSIWGVS